MKRNGKPKASNRAARPGDAGRTGLDPAENGPARHKEFLGLETAVAAILRRSGVAAVVVVETGRALHEAFKGAVAAGCKIHGVASFLVFGIRKAADFFKICGLAYEKRTPLARCPFSSTI